MAITKRTRFEVLNRDNHTCQYCGSKAPDVQLHVDHVIPVALGGDDKPTNLVTACKDCNAGKGASNPDSPLVQRLSAEAATYALEMANKGAAIAQRLRDEAKAVEDFDSTWEQYGNGTPIHRPQNYQESVRRWHRQSVPTELINYAIDTAMRADKVYDRDVFRYMAGVIYRTLDAEGVQPTLGNKPVKLYTEQEMLEKRREGIRLGKEMQKFKHSLDDVVARHIDRSHYARADA